MFGGRMMEAALLSKYLFTELYPGWCLKLSRTGNWVQKPSVLKGDVRNTHTHTHTHSRGEVTWNVVRPLPSFQKWKLPTTKARFYTLFSISDLFLLRGAAQKHRTEPFWRDRLHRLCCSSSNKRPMCCRVLSDFLEFSPTGDGINDLFLLFPIFLLWFIEVV